MTAVGQSTPIRPRPVFGPVLCLMLGRTLAFAATFFIPVVLARVFDPSRFATYKQLFLIHSTVYLIAQVGMATSLYYFLPRAPHSAGRYVANAVMFLGVTGLLGLGALELARPHLALWLNNSELAHYIRWIGLYLFLMMPSAALEIILIARGQYMWASASYLLSDLARAAASILPVLLFHQLDGLLKGLVLVAFVRAVVALCYFKLEFRREFCLDISLLRTQLAYALPFALSVLVEIVQGNLPQYVVAWVSSPATFAIFAVGCLSVPLVDFAASPTSDVMMVRMQESLSAGRAKEVLETWHETTRKLALLFFPLAALVVIAAREIIVLLYTAKYSAAVPIFMVWSMMIPLATLQVDGVLRVFARTRRLLILNLMRLAIIAGLIQWSVAAFSMTGPVLVILLATLAFKTVALLSMRDLLQVRAHGLLPWRNLATVAAAAAAAGGFALAVKVLLTISIFPLLCIVSAVYVAAYALLVWHLNLLSAGERSALADMVRKARGGIGSVLEYGKG